MEQFENNQNQVGDSSSVEQAAGRSLSDQASSLMTRSESQSQRDQLKADSQRLTEQGVLGDLSLFDSTEEDSPGDKQEQSGSPDDSGKKDQAQKDAPKTSEKPTQNQEQQESNKQQSQGNDSKKTGEKPPESAQRSGLPQQGTDRSQESDKTPASGSDSQQTATPPDSRPGQTSETPESRESLDFGSRGQRTGDSRISQSASQNPLTSRATLGAQSGARDQNSR